MRNDKLSRRTFIRNTSLMTAGIIAGPLAAKGRASKKTTGAKKADTSKILNYNPKMGYRRLGKTNLVISEVGLKLE